MNHKKTEKQGSFLLPRVPGHVLLEGHELPSRPLPACLPLCTQKLHLLHGKHDPLRLRKAAAHAIPSRVGGQHAGRRHVPRCACLLGHEPRCACLLGHDPWGNSKVPPIEVRHGGGSICGGSKPSAASAFHSLLFVGALPPFPLLACF